MVIYSHSRLSTFEQCPLKYKFKYIDRLEPDIKQTIEGFLGNKVHDTLEWIYNHPNKHELKLDEVIKHYAESWKNTFTPEIKIIKTEFNEEYYFNQGLKFLINYFKEHSPFNDNTIDTEKKVYVNLDSNREYKLQGYIDRLVHHKEKNIFEIHDYKTGSIKTQEELNKDRQLALYSLGIKDIFEPSEIHLIWHFLAYNKKMKSKRSEDELEELKQKTKELIDKIESTKEFPPKPSILCKWCEFRSYCPLIKNQDLI